MTYSKFQSFGSRQPWGAQLTLMVLVLGFHPISLLAADGTPQDDPVTSQATSKNSSNVDVTSPVTIQYKESAGRQQQSSRRVVTEDLAPSSIPSTPTATTTPSAHPLSSETPATSAHPLGGGDQQMTPVDASWNQGAGSTAPWAGDKFKPSGSVAASGNGRVFSTVCPAIGLELVGPKGIEVGKPELYTVNLQNAGSQVAQGVFVKVTIPAAVTLKDSSATDGELQRHGTEARELVWMFQELPAGSRQKLHLTIVAQTSDQFDLGLEWTILPIANQVAIRAMEPKLVITMEAPTEVAYGERAICKVTLANDGTGIARNVVLQMVTNGKEGEVMNVGTLSAGKQASFPMPLSDLPAGDVELKMIATTDSGKQTDTVRLLHVRRPQLGVRIIGPRTRSAGSNSNYRVDVANIGTAAAENVFGTLTLPSDCKFDSGPAGASLKEGVVTWPIDTLGPGLQRSFTFQLTMVAPGTHKFNAVVNDGRTTRAQCTSETIVETRPNLQMTVEGGSKNVAVGGELVFELHLENTGTQAAERVMLLAELPSHLEPIQVDGHPAEIDGNLIRFQPIPRVGAGSYLLLQVRAKAVGEGQEPFHVEVSTMNPETRIAYESKTNVGTR